MTDIMTKSKRSALMRQIRTRNTMPELVVRRKLHAAGFRFRLHRKSLPGAPDIVLPRFNTCIFVHGCFWHGHHCAKGKRPATNVQFWREKLEKNAERDRQNQKALSRMGWQVFIVWECQIDQDVLSVINYLNNSRTKMLANTERID